MPMISGTLLRTAGPAAFLAACIACQGADAVAASYSFASIRDTNSLGYSEFVGGPSINDDGIVAYIAVRSGQGRIETSGGDFGLDLDFGQQTFSNPTIINGASNPKVAFQFTANSPNVVVLRHPLIYYITANGAFSDFGAPAMNDAGTVAFYADLDNGGKGIFIDEGPFGGDWTIADHEGLFGSFGKTVSIDNSGNVAFLASSGDFHAILLADDGDGFSVLANSSGPLKTLSAPSLNEMGVAAFYGELDNGGSGIFSSSSGGAVTTIANSEGQLSAFGNPTINDSGTVAFSALFDSREHGIFTGGDAVADKVIKIGDPLFGSVASELEFFRGLNNDGQVAFRYSLANGVEGIGVATPVPEGTTLSLALAGLTGMAWGRRHTSR